MIRLSRPRFTRKRPRPIPQHHFYPLLSEMAREQESEYCNECVAKFESLADSERPGHVWGLDKGRVIFLEDKVAESMLGRPLNSDETVIHRDGNVLNNTRANLEIVRIPEVESE